MGKHLHLVIVFILGFAAAVMMGSPSEAADRPSSSPGTLTGGLIPDVELVDMEGHPVSFLAHLRRSSSLLMILDAEACLGCGDYATELRILKRKLPHLQPVVVGVGPDTTLFLEYFRRNRIEGLLDPTMKLSSQAGIDHTSLVAIVDTTARILFIDPRTGPQSQGFPISRLLPHLTDHLTPQRPAHAGTEPIISQEEVP